MQIVSDRGMDMAPEQMAGLDIHLVPLTLTLDGKIAAPDDNQGWITSDAARAHDAARVDDARTTDLGLGRDLSEAIDRDFTEIRSF